MEKLNQLQNMIQSIRNEYIHDGETNKLMHSIELIHQAIMLIKMSDVNHNDIAARLAAVVDNVSGLHSHHRKQHRIEQFASLLDERL